MNTPPRTCRKCHAAKPETPDYWHRSTSRENGYEPICKACRNKRNAARYARIKAANDEAEDVRRMNEAMNALPRYSAVMVAFYDEHRAMRWRNP